MKFLTLTEYAAKHGKSTSEIRRLIKEGRINYEVEYTSPLRGEYRIPDDEPYPEPQQVGAKRKSRP